MGKNLATKEDIEEITKKVEEVKTAVPFSKQQKYDNILQQKQLIVDILNDATIITQLQNKLLLYLYDTSSRKRYDALVEKVSDTLTHFYYVSNLALVTVSIDIIEDVIKELSLIVTIYGSQVSVTATNAASLVDQFNNQVDYAKNQVQDGHSKTLWIANSVQTKRQIEALRDKSNPYKDEMQHSIEK